MLQKSVGPIRKSWIFASPQGQKKQLGVMETPIRGDEMPTLHFYNYEVEAIPQIFLIAWPELHFTRRRRERARQRAIGDGILSHPTLHRLRIVY